MIKVKGRGRAGSWSKTPAGSFGTNWVVVVVVMLLLAKAARRDAFDIGAKPQFFPDLQQSCRLPVVRSRFGW